MPPADSTPPTGSRTIPLMPPLPGGTPAAAPADPLIFPTVEAETGPEPSPEPVPASPYPSGVFVPPASSSTPPPSCTPPPGYTPPPYSYAPLPYPPLPYPPGAVPPPPNSRRRSGYIIAGIGSVLALLAFFAFPFFTVFARLAPSSFTYSQAVTASQLASSSQSFSLGATTGLGDGTASVLWITALAALAALILCVAVPFSTAAIRNGPHHFAGWALIAGGLVNVALTVIIGLMTLDQINQAIRGVANGFGLNAAPIPIDFGISAQLGIGFYVLIASLLIMAAGGIVVLARRDPLAQPSVPFAAPPTRPTM